MVGNAADSERLHFVGSRDSAHVSPKPRLEFFRNAGDPVFGGKDAMKEQAASCVVGHRLAILMLSRPLRDFSLCLHLSRHLSARALGVPGYSQSRLSALGIASNPYLFRRSNLRCFTSPEHSVDK